MSAEDQINEWISLLRDSQLLPADMQLSSTLVGNLQQDDVSSLICYLVFNLQEEISIDKRIPYILQRLGYSLQSLHDVPNLQEFALRLAQAIGAATRDQELLPLFEGDLRVYVLEDEEQPEDEEETVQQNEQPNAELETGNAIISVRLDDANAGCPLPIEASPVADEEDAGTVEAVAEELQRQTERTIQEELVQEIQNLNQENQQLQEKARLLQEISEYVKLQFELEICNDNEPNFAALDEVGRRVCVNEVELELDAAKMRNPNYVSLLQEQMQQLLEGSPFEVEIVPQETPSSVQHIKQISSDSEELGRLEGTIETLNKQIEQMSQEIALLKNQSAINDTERSSSNMNRHRRGEESDDFEAFVQAEEPGSDFLVFIAERLQRAAKQAGIEIGTEEITEDSVLSRLDAVLFELRQKATKFRPDVSETPKNVETDQLPEKCVVDTARPPTREQGQKISSTSLHIRLAKAESVIEENVKMRLELENEIQGLQAQLEGAQRRCRASEIAYESERLASKRVKAVDKYGLDRLNQELADVRKLALLKGLKK